MNNWFELLLYNGVLPFLWVVPRGGRARDPCSNHETGKLALPLPPFLYISTAKGCNRQDNDSRRVVHRSRSLATNISSLRVSQILSLIDTRTEGGKSTQLVHWNWGRGWKMRSNCVTARPGQTQPRCIVAHAPIISPFADAEGSCSRANWCRFHKNCASFHKSEKFGKWAFKSTRINFIIGGTPIDPFSLDNCGKKGLKINFKIGGTPIDLPKFTDVEKREGPSQSLTYNYSNVA